MDIKACFKSYISSKKLIGESLTFQDVLDLLEYWPDFDAGKSKITQETLIQIDADGKNLLEHCVERSNWPLVDFIIQQLRPHFLTELQIKTLFEKTDKKIDPEIKKTLEKTLQKCAGEESIRELTNVIVTASVIENDDECLFVGLKKLFEHTESTLTSWDSIGYGYWLIILGKVTENAPKEKIEHLRQRIINTINKLIEEAYLTNIQKFTRYYYLIYCNIHFMINFQLHFEYPHEIVEACNKLTDECAQEFEKNADQLQIQIQCLFLLLQCLCSSDNNPLKKDSYLPFANMIINLIKELQNIPDNLPTIIAKLCDRLVGTLFLYIQYVIGAKVEIKNVTSVLTMIYSLLNYMWNEISNNIHGISEIAINEFRKQLLSHVLKPLCKNIEDMQKSCAKNEKFSLANSLKAFVYLIKRIYEIPSSNTHNPTTNTDSPTSKIKGGLNIILSNAIPTYTGIGFNIEEISPKGAQYQICVRYKAERATLEKLQKIFIEDQSTFDEDNSLVISGASLFHIYSNHRAAESLNHRIETTFANLKPKPEPVTATQESYDVPSSSNSKAARKKRMRAANKPSAAATTQAIQATIQSKHIERRSNLISGISKNTLIYQEIPGDGHCLYHAVAIYLGKDQQQLRKDVAEHLLDKTEQYIEFIPNDRSLEQYINDVRSGFEWADHLEISILMKLLNRPIVIINQDGKIQNPDVISNYSDEPIFVFYNAKNQHYDALLLANPESQPHDVLNILQPPQKNVKRKRAKIGASVAANIEATDEPAIDENHSSPDSTDKEENSPKASGAPPPRKVFIASVTRVLTFADNPIAGKESSDDELDDTAISAAEAVLR